nr:hypothetical protein [Tanacetum cinerariifolium]
MKANASGGNSHNFYVGKEFTSRETLKDRIKKHSVETRRNIMLVKNDFERVRATCFGVVPTLKNCDGEFGTRKGHVDISVAKKGGPALGNCIKGKNITLDSLKQKKKDKHVGKDQGSIDKGKKVTVEKKEDEKKIPVKAVQEQIHKKFSLGISRTNAFRVKKYNPNTTVKIEVQPPTDAESNTRIFKRIYVCIGALKFGFKAGLRDILGLDGAFIKGPFYGLVLTAVNVDECLGSDLELGMVSKFTFVTDRQKGGNSAGKESLSLAVNAKIKDTTKELARDKVEVNKVLLDFKLMVQVEVDQL